MDWFELYSDVPNDPKIGMLKDSEFRTWIELLCYAGKESDNGNTGLQEGNVSWALRRKVEEDVKILADRGLVTINKGGFIIITNWYRNQVWYR